MKQEPGKDESSTRLSNAELVELFSDEVSDHDLIGSIKIVKMLLGEEALPFLLHVLKSSWRSYEIRKGTAEAIRDIGAESVVETLSSLERADDPHLRELATLALSWVRDKK